MLDLKKCHFLAFLLAGMLFFLPKIVGAQVEEDDLTFSGEVVSVGGDNITIDVGGNNVTVPVDSTVENDMDGDDALEDMLETLVSGDQGANGTAIEIGEIVEMEASFGKRGLILNRIRRPFKRDILWLGPASYEDGNLTCAGIKARVLDESAGDPFSTLIIGQYGEKVSIGDLDLTSVRVRIGYSDDNGYFVKRIVQGPILDIRGLISEVDEDQSHITVNGLSISLNDNTVIRAFRSILVSKGLDRSVLRSGLPVRVLAQYINNEYFAVGILVLRQNLVRFRALINEIEDDGTAVVQTPGTHLTLKVKLDTTKNDLKPGDFVTFSGEIFENGQIGMKNIGKVGQRSSRDILTPAPSFAKRPNRPQHLGVGGKIGRRIMK